MFEERLPALRQAFALPFQWVEGRDHDPCLPKSVARLACDVLDCLRGTACADLGEERWGLVLSRDAGLAGVDLSGLELGCDSGWAALAGGLLVAIRGGIPDPSIWATGAWQRDAGISPVDRVPEKLQLAREFGAKTVFVPEGSPGTTETCDLEIAEIPAGQPDPVMALRELVRRQARPGREADLDERIAFYLHNISEPDRAREYYRSDCLEDVGCKLAREREAQRPGWRPRMLVTVVSDSPELAELTVRVLGPERTVLLHKGKSYHDLKTALEPGTVCSPIPFDENAPAEIAKLSSGLTPDEIAFDLTPGTKMMSLELAYDIAPAGARLVYWEHEIHKAYKRPDPRTLRLHVWTAHGPGGAPSRSEG